MIVQNKRPVCFQCKEEIGPDDPIHRYPDGDLAHKNCHLRQIIGSVAHVERRCGCYVEDSEAGDPEGLTKRQAANAAVEAWEKKQKLLVN